MMRPAIGIVDYGLGNISAFLNIYRDLGVTAFPVSDSTLLSKVSHLILPGVGSFDWAMSRLDHIGIRDKLNDLVCDAGLPVLGVCVGFQIMCMSSEEGSSPGLSWLDADVRTLRNADNFTQAKDLILPHMGWNLVSPKQPYHPLFQGISDLQFYFLHSYCVSVNSPSIAIADAYYGDQFCCAAGESNVLGVQFHPEKSHQAGDSLLKNFSKFASC
jgi:glutamine amidotransferase